jgi:hypothetical protein
MDIIKPASWIIKSRILSALLGLHKTTFPYYLQMLLNNSKNSVVIHGTDTMVFYTFNADQVAMDVPCRTSMLFLRQPHG